METFWASRADEVGICHFWQNRFPYEIALMFVPQQFLTCLGNEHMTIQNLTKLVPLSEVPKLLPKRNGKHPHISTICRWAIRGVKGRKLKTVVLGGLRYTTMAALQDFLVPSSGFSIEELKGSNGAKSDPIQSLIRRGF